MDKADRPAPRELREETPTTMRGAYTMRKPTPTRDTVQIGYVAQDAYIWQCRQYLMKRYSVDESARDVAPLSWYIATGRAYSDWLRALMCARPYMIARILHRMSGGDYSEIIAAVTAYIQPD